MVVAQLTEQSLPIPEDPGSNPFIGNFYELFAEKTIKIAQEWLVRNFLYQSVSTLAYS